MESPRSENDIAINKTVSVRRHYRIIVDSLRRLDHSFKDGKKSLLLISQTDFCLIRDRLRDSCDKLLFLSPLEYGKKMEDLIWKRCFYEPIQLLRTNKEKLTSKQKSWMILLLQSAIGYYHSLLLRLQRHFELDYECITVPLLSTIRSGHKNTPESCIWALGAVYKTLVYLGDLMRYKLDLVVDDDDFYLAEHYYLEAYNLDPSQGMPMNQLGNLADDRNHGLDSLFYYLRGMICDNIFEGTRGNIAFTFKWANIAREKCNNSENQTLENPDRFCLSFVNLMHIFYDDLEISPKEFSTSVQMTLTNLRSACYSARNYDNLEQKQIITPDIFLHAFLVQIMIRTHLEQNESSKFKAITVFILDNLTILFDHVTKLAKNFSIIEKNEQDEEKVEQNKYCEHKNGRYSESPPVPQRRRRKRRGNCSEHRLDTSQSMDENSDDYSQDVVELSTTSSDEEDTGLVSQNRHSEDHQFSTNDIADANEHRKEHHWLPVVKLTIDWLRNCTETVFELAQVCKGGSVSSGVLRRFWTEQQILLNLQGDHPLWKTVVDMIDVLPNETDLVAMFTEGIDTHRQLNEHYREFVLFSEVLIQELGNLPTLGNFVQTRALPEDVLLRGVPSFDEIHANLDFDQKQMHSWPTIVRIVVIRSFGHHLTHLKLTGFSVDSSGCFSITLPNTDRDDRRAELMTKMAKLCLLDEQKRLEKTAWIPVYLVPDLAVFIDRLAVVKQLVGAHKFVVVVPKSSIAELDRRKKNSGSVRETIRWLQLSLQQGAKYVRTQNDSEVGRLEDTGNLQKDMVDTLCCCAGLSSSAASKGAVFVTILTCYSERSSSFRMYKDMIETQHIYGVNVANIHQFNKRWLAHGRNRR